MKTSVTKSLQRLAAVATALLIMAGSAHAVSVLLYDDFINLQDTWGTALSGLGLSATTVSSDSSFASTINTSFDLVVVQFDESPHSINTALGSYLSAGGKVVFSHWKDQSDSLFGIAAISLNSANLQITSSTIGDGLSDATQSLINPTYGIFSREFHTVGQTVLATLGGGAGILLTNGGNAIVNGFLGETIRLGSDEVRLYQNEIKLLMPAIPEPSTYLMTILGLGAIGVLARKRRQIPRRNRINDLHASPAALLPS